MLQLPKCRHLVPFELPLGVQNNNHWADRHVKYVWEMENHLQKKPEAR